MAKKILSVTLFSTLFGFLVLGLAQGSIASASSCLTAIGSPTIPHDLLRINALPENYFWVFYSHLPKTWQEAIVQSPKTPSEFRAYFNRRFGRYLKPTDVLFHVRAKFLRHLEAGGESLDTWIPKQMRIHTKEISPSQAREIEIWMADKKDYIRAISQFDKFYFVEIPLKAVFPLRAKFQIGEQTFVGMEVGSKLHLTVPREAIRIPHPETLEQQHLLGFTIQSLESPGLTLTGYQSAMIGLDGKFYLMGQPNDSAIDLPAKVKISLDLPLRTMRLRDFLTIGMNLSPADHMALVKLSEGSIEPLDLIPRGLRYQLAFQPSEFIRP